MLIAYQAAKDATINGLDGRLGALYDLLFARKSWDIRYLTVTTGQRLGLRRVLLSVETVDRCDWADRALAVRVNQDQVSRAPEPNEVLPSRREEYELTFHFGWRPFRETTVPHAGRLARFGA